MQDCSPREPRLHLERAALMMSSSVVFPSRGWKGERSAEMKVTRCCFIRGNRSDVRGRTVLLGGGSLQRAWQD